MSSPFGTLGLSVCCALGLTACLLPSYEAIDAEPETTVTAACGDLSTLSTSCGNCIASQCCSEASTCSGDADCADHMAALITPLQSIHQDFEPLLQCMSTLCEQACNVTWGCLDRYSFSAPADTYDRTVLLSDFANESPVDDVSVRACQGVSPDCSSGLQAEAISTNGVTTLANLAPNFQGYFSFSGGSRDQEPYVDATVQWSEPVYRHADFTHFMLRESDLRSLAQLTGYHSTADEPFAADRGHLIVRVQGCLPFGYLNNPNTPRAEAANVVISASPNDGASRFYYTDLRTGGMIDTNLDATTKDGVAGAFELPAGLVTVVARRSDNGAEVARAGVRVEAGKLSYVYLLPRGR